MRPNTTPVCVPQYGLALLLAVFLFVTGCEKRSASSGGESASRFPPFPAEVYQRYGKFSDEVVLIGNDGFKGVSVLLPNEIDGFRFILSAHQHPLTGEIKAYLLLIKSRSWDRKYRPDDEKDRGAPLIDREFKGQEAKAFVTNMEPSVFDALVKEAREKNWRSYESGAVEEDEEIYYKRPDGTLVPLPPGIPVAPPPK